PPHAPRSLDRRAGPPDYPQPRLHVGGDRVGAVGRRHVLAPVAIVGGEPEARQARGRRGPFGELGGVESGLGALEIVARGEGRLKGALRIRPAPGLVAHLRGEGETLTRGQPDQPRQRQLVLLQRRLVDRQPLLVRLPLYRRPEAVVRPAERGPPP